MRYLACRCAALSFALLASGLAVAADSAANTGTTTIYRWLDSQGVVHYSDAPQPGAQQLHVAPAQTYTSSPVQAVPAAVGEPVAAYQDCTIAQPAPEQSFYAPDSVAVSVQLTPALSSGDRLTLTEDGKALVPADNSGLNFQIDNPDRGAHSLSAVVLNASGTTVCRAPVVTFYVQRPSLLSPQSPARAPAAPPGLPH